MAAFEADANEAKSLYLKQDIATVFYVNITALRLDWTNEGSRH